MEKENNGYNLVNILVLLITTIVFVIEYRDIGILFRDIEVRYWLALILTVCVVHAIKAFRLYLALYGAEITLSAYLKTYCKVTPVSVILPFKMGELFRMYCYGRQIKSLGRGVIIVLLDRFMDTLALVTMIFAIKVFNGGKVPNLAFVLMLFLAVMFIAYYVFPGIYDFWKKFLLAAKATKNKMAVLKMIAGISKIHQEITNVARGRGFILYVLSLLAWGIELCSIAFIGGIVGHNDLNKRFSRYMSSAMGMGGSTELKRFVVVSVITLIAAYIVIKIKDILNIEGTDA